MPSKSPAITDDVANCAVVIGKHIRAHRKSLRVSATTAAQAAGMSRVTWYRLEKGEPSVTMGAYLSAMNVLGLEFKTVSYDVEDFIYKRESYRKKIVGPGHIDFAGILETP